MDVELLYQKLRELKKQKKIHEDDYNVFVNRISRIKSYNREIQILQEQNDNMDNRVQLAYVKMNKTEKTSTNYLTARSEFEHEENLYYRFRDRIGDLLSDRQDEIRTVNSKLNLND